MRKTLAIMAILVLVLVGAAFGVEQTVSASVTVTQYVSVTIAPCAGTLSFGGSVNPGTNDNPVACQGAGTAAINITNNAVSNKVIDVSTKGTNFNGTGGTIAIGQAEFDESNAKPSATTLTTAYLTSSTSVAVGSSAGIWYWLDIPSAQAAGTYTSTFSVKGE